MLEHFFCRYTSRMTKETRRTFIDLLRGAAIFLMLWGHCIQYCSGAPVVFFENPAFRFIYSFHMPLFMLISGFLFFGSSQKRNLGELLSHRSIALIHPILMCTIFNYFITIGISSIAAKQFSAFFGGKWLDSLTSLWFLWSVLSSSISVALAFKISNKAWIRSIVLLLGIGLAAMFPCSTMNLYMYPYFVIGFLLGKYEEKWLKYINLIGAASLIGFILLIPYYKREHFIYTTGLFGNNFILVDSYRWAIGLFGSIAAVWILLLLFSIPAVQHLNISNGLISLGKNSLSVYSLSVALLSYWLPIIAKFVFSATDGQLINLALYNFIITPLIALCYSFVLLFIISFFKRAGIHKILFGR